MRGIGIHFEAWNRGFTLGAATLTQVALTGVPLDFDLYAYVDDEEPRGESAAGVS